MLSNLKDKSWRTLRDFDFKSIKNWWEISVELAIRLGQVISERERREALL
jgi:hypothetical protein